jgi:hypothetical protein
MRENIPTYHYVVNYRHMPTYCSRCKKDFPRDELVIYGHRIYKGRDLIYYACRPCKRLVIHKVHPGRQRARTHVYAAVKSGKLIRPPHCSQCDNPKVQAHHDDYSKSLEVVWVCRKHHGLLHVGAKPIHSSLPRRWKPNYRRINRAA